MRIDELAVRRPGHGVDREVPAQQIVLERYVGIGMHLEALMAGARLSLSAGKGILLVSLRMQEHGKIATHPSIAERQHVVDPSTDNNPVPIANGAPEQVIAHRAAYEVCLHGANLADGNTRRR